jgi:hypothetical protein
MSRPLPPWVATHGIARDDAEAREYAVLTPQERWERFVALSGLASTLLAANDRCEVAVTLRDERSPESLALWHKLMARYRHG